MAARGRRRHPDTSRCQGGRPGEGAARFPIVRSSRLAHRTCALAPSSRSAPSSRPCLSAESISSAHWDERRRLSSRPACPSANSSGGPTRAIRTASSEYTFLARRRAVATSSHDSGSLSRGWSSRSFSFVSRYSRCSVATVAKYSSSLHRSWRPPACRYQSRDGDDDRITDADGSPAHHADSSRLDGVPGRPPRCARRSPASLKAVRRPRSHPSTYLRVSIPLYGL
jgi:hypothetical protein